MSVQVTEISTRAVFRYLAQVVVADGQIHSDEEKLLEAFLDSQNASEDNRAMIAKVYHEASDPTAVDELLNTLRELGPETQRMALQQGLILALADEFITKEEEEFFQRSIATWGMSQIEYQEMRMQVQHTLNIPQQFRESIRRDRLYSRLDHPMVLGLLRVIQEAGPQAIANKAHDLRNQVLLAGQEYGVAINKSKQVAEADLNYVQPFLEHNIEFLADLIDRIRGYTADLETSKDESIDVKGTLVGITDSIQSLAARMLEESETQLDKKRRALSYFTISFMGKTKVGKTTLHSVITGQGHDEIGVGKQRTTRYNRVYTWENIRIIDTPGIGAPGGKTDEEIAQSIIDETDVMCYVVKNDSIQESEFSFLHLLKEKNKPLIVLLNVKENLANPQRLELFLKDPEKIYTRTDEKSLKGHIDRIKRHILDYYPNTHFEIIPVQLYAALLSRDESKSSNAEKLYKASHIQQFLDSLKLAIIEDGVLRRSQTFLDGTALAMHAIAEDLHSHGDVLRDLDIRLRNQREQVMNRVDKGYHAHRKSLEESLRESFQRLKSGGHSFAQEHYEDGEDEIRDAWARHIKKMKFEKTLETKVRSSFEGFVVELKQYIDELTEDLSFLKFDSGEVKFDLQSTFSAHIVLNVLSVVGKIASGIVLLFELSNPIGWVIAGLTALFSWAKRLFKSKEDRISEAVNKLSESLLSGIEDQEQKIVPEVLQRFDDFKSQVVSNVDKYYVSMENALEKVITELSAAEDHVRAQAVSVDGAYAWRLLNFAMERECADQALSQDVIKQEIVRVERLNRHELKVTSPVRLSTKKIEALERILQHKVIFATQ